MNGKRALFDIFCSVENDEQIPESVAMRCVMMHFLGRAGQFFCVVLSCARPVAHRRATESKKEERRAKESEGEQRRTKNKQRKHQ